MKTHKKLIEVALPLEAINEASAREKSIRHGHPSTLHLWWARRPLAAARAVIFAQMVDDPSSWPDLFPTEKAQEKERQRLFRIIEDLVQWENTTSEVVLQRARDEIWRSWRRACAENADHPQAKELFDRDKLPAFHDPFAGGGALPLEAQRLGLEAYASDLNPVAVLINKAMIEIPPKFAGMPPVHPEIRQSRTEWTGAQGLAEDVRYYGQWMRDEAEKRIGHLYPKVRVTPEMVAERPDLNVYEGKELTVIAWIWARTVRSPSPAFRNVDVPLASTFILSTKPGKEAWVEPVICGENYRFRVHPGKPTNPEPVQAGTKLGRGANFGCLISGAAITAEYLQTEGKAGRLGTRLMAIVAEGEGGRVYLPPTIEHEKAALCARDERAPIQELPKEGKGGRTNFWCSLYGLTTFGDLFTNRQLAALLLLSDLVGQSCERVRLDAESCGHPDSNGYAQAISTYLAFLVNQIANHSASVCGWNSANAQMRSVFARQGIPMVWDFAESNIFSDSSGSFNNLFERQVKGFEAICALGAGFSEACDAAGQHLSSAKVVSTDPPYYDNIGYADLSDFFYVWLRRSLKSIYPELFATIAVPKDEELVATPFRHGSKELAERFFLIGMTEAMRRLCEQAHPSFPVTIYYAFKQSETTDSGGHSSTGWETFLDAVVRSGFSVTGTWPIRTEKEGRAIGNDANALASSIVLVCRSRDERATTVSRRDFLAALERELPEAVADLQRGNVAPVDLQQAAIGPGMAVFTRYAKVLDADGKPLSVRNALAMINQALDETLAQQEGDFDGDTRWALAWFEQFGFVEGEYGIAEVLSKAKATSVQGVVDAGIAISGKGKVRLLKPEELLRSWTPEGDKRLTVWDMVHHLIRVLEKGEPQAAELMAKLGTKAEAARELAYRLFAMCNRKKRSEDAQRYNALVQSWPEIVQLSQTVGSKTQEQGAQGGLFDGVP